MPCTTSSKNIQRLICSQNLECPQPTYTCTRSSKCVTRNTSTFILGTTPQQNSLSTLMKTKLGEEPLRVFRQRRKELTNLIPTPCPFVYDVDQLFSWCLFVYPQDCQNLESLLKWLFTDLETRRHWHSALTSKICSEYCVRVCRHGRSGLTSEFEVSTVYAAYFSRNTSSLTFRHRQNFAVSTAWSSQTFQTHKWICSQYCAIYVSRNTSLICTHMRVCAVYLVLDVRTYE
jgi:hypothetical protein